MIFPEYALGSLVAIAAIAAISLHVQRGLQAKMRDARVFMVDTASKGCVASADPDVVDCQDAAGVKNGRIADEYEPYYTKSDAAVSRNQHTENILLGGGIGSTGIVRKTAAETTRVSSLSEQLPPKDQK